MNQGHLMFARIQTVVHRAATALSLLGAIAIGHGAEAASALERGFRAPPEATKPWCYWYWISDNISKAGLTRDLEAMARAGIGEAFIGNVDVNEKSRGPVKVLSEEWWSMVEHAIREGGRLGVNIGLFNCPGWSQSGGPWVKPGQTMRYVAVSETRVQGPAKFAGKLPVPKEPFQDIAVLAFPAPRLDTDTVAAHAPRVTCTPAAADTARLTDGKLDTVCNFPPNATTKEPFVVDFEFAEPFTARSLVLHPAPQPFAVTCELQAADAGGQFQSVRKLVLDRSNTNLHVGPLPYGPVAVAFPPVTARQFRLVFTGLPKQGGLAEIELTGAARLERYVEKQLGKMVQTPLPLWDASLWPPQTEPDVAGLAVRADQVLNLSDRLAADGTLRWDAPAGEWIVLRAGMTPTGVKNAPASPEGTGYEIDKMNRQWLAAHFDAFIGEVLRRMPAADRKAFRHVVADSYEMGSQNWTDGFAAGFRARYGYDPLRWLPVLTGRIVGSADQSDRFLWDVRRLVADRISRAYVGGLRDLCEQNGLRLWLENYGHWGFPGEFLQYGGQSHDLGGEFWATGDLGSIELRAASSAAHLYGKRIVSAEAFTSAGPHWTMDPWWQKRRGDWACTEGANHFVLHVFIHQPFADRVPGVNAWFGTEFNHHNTWFSQARGWIDYLRRTHFLLQQGRSVADVAYFIGEDTPKMTGVRKPELPPGYSFDYINAEVIEQRLRVKGGKFVLPDGTSYRLLVLPELATMRPELLRKLRDLVKAGGAVLGPPPSRSPSLENYPACDREVQKLAGDVWKGCDGNAATHARFDKGHVFRGVDVQAALDQLQVPPEVSGLDAKVFPWTHRTTPEGELYFISHQGDQPVTVTPSFRVAGRLPELWDAVTGERRDLPEFAEEKGRTVVPLEFAPRQSLFVGFRRPRSEVGARKSGKNFPTLATLGELTGAWTVKFDPKRGGPESVVFDRLVDWTQRPEDGIKFYSGAATYQQTFDLPDGAPRRRLYLDLGEVKSLARVHLNGQDLGVVWCAPWRVDITRAAKSQGNNLAIEVVNTWANRLIGDAKLPPEKRFTWTAVPTLGPNSPLLPAGLLGPVRIVVESPPDA